MAKRIVICCDGTWNDEEDKTNVFLARQFIAQDSGGLKQKVCYDEGVGNGFGELLRGGVAGYGLSKNVREAYKVLVDNYEEGDEVFLLGFSRGAFTVRSLAGFLGVVDLLDRSERNRIDDAYRYYRLKRHDRARSSFAHDLLRMKRRRVCIKFLGVYDTVGSLGIPMPTFSRITEDLVDFHDTELGDNVENAYHALAIDERRGPFKATYWTDAPGVARRADGSLVEQNVFQVWFSGAHADVGGGYRERGLSDISLHWMLNRAEECGLALDRTALDSLIKPDSGGALHDSMNAVWKAAHALRWTAEPYVRPIGPIQRRERGEPWSVVNERVHESVFARLSNALLAEPYVPKNLVNNGMVRTDILAMPRFIERKSARRSIYEEGQIGEARCVMFDVSEKGARIGVDARMQVGSLVILESRTQGKRPCRVIWSQKEAAGLAFERAA